jgi:hypothetical protein
MRSPAQCKEIIRGDRLDWTFGWDDPAPDGPWLQDGETITSYTVTVDAPLVLEDDSESAGTVTAWVSCPDDATVGTVAGIKCAIVTSAGRETSRTRELTIV